MLLSDSSCVSIVISSLSHHSLLPELLQQSSLWLLCFSFTHTVHPLPRNQTNQLILMKSDYLTLQCPPITLDQNLQGPARLSDLLPYHSHLWVSQVTQTCSHSELTPLQFVVSWMLFSLNAVIRETCPNLLSKTISCPDVLCHHLFTSLEHKIWTFFLY
jgi:hypothetical protein